MGLMTNNLKDLVLQVAEIFKPPERLTVSEAAQKYVKLSNPPAYEGPYLNGKAPYMVEPMDTTQSRYHTSVIFCGPAQSAKTEALIMNTLAYQVKCNPMDVILYHISQSAAADFSRRRVDKMHRHSDDIRAELASGQHSDNTFNKRYRSSMLFTISWPSINEMSSKPVPVVMLTDYDRMPDDIDGEGSPFSLAQKRTQSFRNFGMTIVETSPGREIENVKYVLTGAHEAPPCKGVLTLYNQGDRRRWNWPCPHCREFFEPAFSLLVYDTMHVDEVTGDRVPMTDAEIDESTFMACPRNGCKIEHHHKEQMNLQGVWLREGETIDKYGVRTGKGRVSKSASFWLKGPAAAFITWGEMVLKYLNAEDSYLKTGDEQALKTTVNTDQGEPYRPKGTESMRLAEDLMDRAKSGPDRTVPDDVRALMATCDVQKNRWEIQVMGIRPGYHLAEDGVTKVYMDGVYDIVVIDRFPIIKSQRIDPNTQEHAWVKPAVHSEDWDLLVTEVMDKRYALADGSGDMGIHMTFCDSGGKDGVTGKAYEFYRKLKRDGRQDRFHLLKGEPNPKAPRAQVSWPDTNRKDRSAKARGEIPVLFLQTNLIKDTLNGMLDKTDPGGGYVEFPDWLALNFFEELTVEIRTLKGWENPAGRRNESWDLLVYFIGACISRGVEHVRWATPPTWLKPWRENSSVVITAPVKDKVDKPESQPHRLASLGAELG